MQLNKIIAENSTYSRRKAAEIIKEGRVQVNQEPAFIGQKVTEQDEITIDNKKLERNKDKVYIKLNKPSGYTCTNRKFFNEQNIFELMPEYQHLSTIGRLDKDSHGLILLSNDGDLNYKLSHPKFQHEKKYIVSIKSNNTNNNFKQLRKSFLQGIDIEEKTLAKAKDIKEISKNKFEIVLTEGKKRQIRKMFNACDIEVLDLQRIEFAKIKLGQLQKGQYTNLSQAELDLLNNINE